MNSCIEKEISRYGDCSIPAAPLLPSPCVARCSHKMAFSSATCETLSKLSAISVTLDAKVPTLAIITFTRPERLNSFTETMYNDLCDAFLALDRDEAASAVLIRASGRYYSSGADLGEQAKGMQHVMSSGVDLREYLTQRVRLNAHRLVGIMIDFSKPIVAAVHGPAVGISVTTLALCDMVYAAEAATFHTPFMQFGFCAEGCSSVLFADIMGVSKASEVLLLGKTMTAHEAERAGFVSEVFASELFGEQVLQRARKLASFPPNALRQTKWLMREPQRQRLHDANEREITLLVDRFMSEESTSAVLKFMMERQAMRAKM